MHGDFDKLEVLMFCHTLTVRTVKSVRSIRGSALVHIISYYYWVLHKHVLNSVH